jgi:hypothetical protein
MVPRKNGQGCIRQGNFLADCGLGGTTKEDFKRHGYAPQRRAVMYVAGTAINMRPDTAPYKALLLKRKVVEVEKCEAQGLTVVKQDAKNRRDLLPHEIGAIVPHLRALRYVEKRLLTDLWRRWRQLEGMPYEVTAPKPARPGLRHRARKQPT